MGIDINSLVGDDTSFQIPQVAVKWITYALVLHIVALALAAGSAVFGLLAHVREMSMSCCSTCVSGFAAAVALLAFIFDLALFFTAKSRINSVGSASMGNAIWLTLAAWVLLFFSGCMYTLGRCCISNRSPRNKDWNKDSERAPVPAAGNGYNDYAEQMRMDAVKAEADRKAHQKEVGLPAFSETQPLTARVDGDNVYAEPYEDRSPLPIAQPGYGRQTPGGGYAGGGYVQAPVGTRAVDEYYNPTRDNYTAAVAPNSYPPQPNPQRQGSSHTYAPSNYAPSAYSNGPSRITSPSNNSQFLAPAFAHDRASSAPSAQNYGHTAGGTTCKFYALCQPLNQSDNVCLQTIPHTSSTPVVIHNMTSPRPTHMARINQTSTSPPIMLTQPLIAVMPLDTAQILYRHFQNARAPSLRYQSIPRQQDMFPTLPVLLRHYLGL